MNDKRIILPPGELELMNILWRLQEATIREVLAATERDHDPAYTTVQTQLNILVRKGYAQVTKEGKAHRYAPAISRERVQTSALQSLLDNLFDRSAPALAQRLVESGSLTPEDIEELLELVERHQPREDKQ